MASRNRARVRQRLVAAAAILFFILAVAATVTGVWAYRSQQEAVRAERRASEERDRADARLKQAQTTQSLFLAASARQQGTAGDAGTAILLALEALSDDRPYVPEAELQLDGAWPHLRERLILEGHRRGVFSAAFSPDGKRIVTASADKTARLWDAETGKQIGEPLRGHKDWVRSAAFSPDGKRIVTASDDKTARLWDAETSKQIGEPLRGHGNTVVSAAFSPDGKRIVTASGDKTARLWRIFANTQELVSHAKTAVPRCLTAAQRNAFFLPPEPPQWCVELKKWPYHTDEWKQWLRDTQAGKSPKLPAFEQ
jgi:predicted NACHT family NTPase